MTTRYSTRVRADVLAAVRASEEPMEVEAVAIESGHPEGSVRAALGELVSSGDVRVARREPGARRPPRDLRKAMAMALRAAAPRRRPSEDDEEE